MPIQLVPTMQKGSLGHHFKNMTNNHVINLTVVGLDYDDLGGPISGCWNQI